MGNIITKYPVKKILLKSKGISTLAGRKIWYDDILKRLNVDARGKFLGEFDGDDRILTVFANGVYELTSFDLNNHFDDKMTIIEKYNPEKVYSVVHYDGKSKNYLVKRFVFENTVIGKETSIISDEPGSKMTLISNAAEPIVEVKQLKGATRTPETIELNLAEVIDVKGMKAMGNRISQHQVEAVKLIAENNPVEEVIIDDVEEEVAEELIDTDEASETVAQQPESTADVPKPVKNVSETVEQPQTELVAEQQPEKAVEPEPIEKPKTEEPPPIKKIDFEITNPDDIDIDDKGQLGLF